MRELILVLLLLPSLAFGQLERAKEAKGFSEKKAASIASRLPARAVEDTAKRSLTARHFKLGTDAKGNEKRVAIIGLQPMSDVVETALDAKSGYSKRVKIGQSTFDYAPGGPLKYSKGASWFVLVPANFDTLNVGIKYDWHGNGLKEYLYLNEKSPSRLAWHLSESAAGLAARKLSPFIAWDANSDTVEVSAVYVNDSLIVTVDTAKAVWPITVDPSVQDTMDAGISASTYTQTGANWLAARNQTSAATAAAVAIAGGSSFVQSNHAAYWNQRGAIAWDMTGLESVINVDSVRLYLRTDGAFPSVDTTIVSIVEGNWTGGTRAVGWYNDFEGWAASGAYSVTRLDSTPFYFYVADDSVPGWKSVLFTEAGRDLVKGAMGADTLRLMALTRDDIAGSASYYMGAGLKALPYLVVYYSGNPPGVTTDSSAIDSVQVVLHATIDSTGGVDLAVRGFQLLIDGDDADTLDVSETGAFSAEAYSLTTLLLADTSYAFRAYGNNGIVSYGAWDTVSTAIGTGGGALRVDGRTVNRAY